MKYDPFSLIRPDESWTMANAGHCKCGKEYVKIEGSDKTFYKNGVRFAEVGSERSFGWSSFRCGKCSSVLESSWVKDNQEATNEVS